MADNTIQILILAQNLASEVLRAAGGDADGFGERLANAGTRVTMATAGISAALGVAVAAAVSFDASMTNTAAVLGSTREEQAALANEILNFSRDTVAGPQAVSEAFYDIVGGVADATTHMSILEAATRTAEAGAADLGGTTAGLISVMNSYRFSATDAAFASDVLTQTVGRGVGTMDEFAAAMPQVTGLASSLGIGFDTVGASMAYLTTQGFSASQAATQLRAMMLSMLNPNAAMKQAFEELGFTSGQAAIEQYGLVEALQMVADTAAVSENGMAMTLGSAEALMGVTALATDEATDALETFTETLDGATESARNIQMTSAANQMALLNSSVQAISIQVGQALIPAINDLIAFVRPLLDSVFEWIQANPELTGTIIGVVAALTLLGPIMIGVGGAIAVLTSPITLVIAAIAALAVAFETNFLGIRDILAPVFDFIGNVVESVTVSFGNFTDTVNEGGTIIDGVISVISGALGNLLLAFGFLNADTFVAFRDAVEETLNGMVSIITDTVLPALQELGRWFLQDILPPIVEFVQGTVWPILSSFFEFLGNVWSMVGPALQNVADWFINDALPAVRSFLVDSVIPAVESFFNTVGQLWEMVRPHLEALADWFLNTALPAVLNFITTFVIPVIGDFVNAIRIIWETVSPALISLADWFLNTGLPLIRDFVENVVIPVVELFIESIRKVWEVVQPALSEIYEWFVTYGLPFIQTVIQQVQVIWEGFVRVLQEIWQVIQPALQSVYDWFVTTGMPAIQVAIDVIQAAWDILVSALGAIWRVVEKPLQDLLNGMNQIFGWINTNIIQPVIQAIEAIPAAVQAALDAIGQFLLVKGQVDFGDTGAGSAITAYMGYKSAHPDPDLSYGEWDAAGRPPMDFGGRGQAGSAYMIGKGAQPELFIPNAPGIFVPNFDELFGGGDTNNKQVSYQIAVTITEREVLDEGTAERNGELFGMRLAQEIGYRG